MFEESIVPKEEPIDSDNILIQKFLVEKNEDHEKKKKFKAVRMSSVPSIVKEPANKDDHLFQVYIQEFSDINL